MPSNIAKTITIALSLLLACLTGFAQDSLNISRVGQIPITADWWGKALMIDTYAYLPTAGSCIEVIDLSDLDDPREVITLTVPGSGYPKLMLDQHDVLYVQLYRNRFEWYDVSNSAEPVFLGFMTTPEGLEGMTCDEDILVVTGHAPESLYDGWMQVYSLNDPHHPEQIHDGQVSEALGCANLDGDYLYIAGHYSVRTFDMNNPEEPVECSSLFIPCWSMTALYRFEDYLHIAFVDDARHSYEYRRVIDLSDPALPIDVGTILLDGDPLRFHDQVVLGDTLLILPGLRKIVFHEPSQASIVWENPTPNPGSALKWLSCWQESESIIVNNKINLSHFNVEEAEFSSLIDNTLSSLHKMTVEDSLLVVTNNESVRIYNVADPDTPVARDTFTVMNDYCPKEMQLKDGALYMSLMLLDADEYDWCFYRALGAYDLTTIQGPCLLYFQDRVPDYFSYATIDSFYHLKSSDTRMFYLAPSAIVALDITDPHYPADLAVIPVGEDCKTYSGFAVNDTILYLTTYVFVNQRPPAGYFQGYVFPESGEAELLFETPFYQGYSHRFYQRNNILYREYISTETYEVEVQLYDITNPVLPRYQSTITSWFPRENQAKLIIDGDYAFVADSVEGVIIYYFDSDTSYVQIGHSDMWGPAYQMEVDNDLLYIKNRHRVGIYDISNALAVSEPKHQATSEFLPIRVVLDAPWPNPFNSSTTVSWTLPQQEHVSLVVYDILGRRVRTLCNEVRTAGAHRIHWDGTNEANRLVSSGTYFLRLETESGTMTRSIHLVK